MNESKKATVGDAELVVYPIDPIPAAKNLINHLRGNERLPLNEQLHCCYHLLGVGLGLYDPRLMRSAEASDNAAGITTNEQKADVLERCFVNQPKGGAEDVAKAIPWKTVWLVVRGLIDQILSQ